jgi:peptide/nickel transport system ATP-binding protein
MALLEVRDLVKDYPDTRRGTFRAVDGVSFDIHAGETLGIVGESGCGKTTLGRMILRLVEPTSGTVQFDGTNVLAAPASQLRALRRQMQIVFQDPFSSLNPRMRVEEIITEPLVIHERLSKSDLQQRAVELVRSVGLEEAALRRYPHEFSGGQRQRICIARALALKPKFIVADEPVSALDVSVGARVVNLLRDLQQQFQLTYMFISHSMPVVRYLSTRIAVMQAGKIVEIGDAEQVTSAPAHSYTRKLLEATPELQGQEVRAKGKFGTKLPLMQ